MVDCYQFTGQADHGVVVDRNAVLMLDTMVLSTIYSTVKQGFDLSRLQDRRAAHLLRWLAARPDVAVSPLFGVLEGSGFHAGGLDPLDVVRRFVAAFAFSTWGREHAERWIASGEPAAADISIPDDRVDPEAAIELGEALLPWTVLPCYVAALAAALIEREGRGQLEAVRALHHVLASDLDFVPAFGWLVGALMFIGTDTVRRGLRGELFKLDGSRLRRQCLSAGWDLGYLELMSIARTPTVQPLFEGRTPLLVTEDKQLAPSAIRLLCHGNTGAFEIDGDLLDPAWCDEAIDLLEELYARRTQQLSVVRIPTWEGCVRVAQRLERELGIVDAPALTLRPPPIVIELEPRAAHLWLDAIAIAEAGPALKLLIQAHETGMDILTSGACMVALLVRDNARARARELKPAWESVLNGLDPAFDEAAIPALVAKLVLSVAEENWAWSTAVFKKVVLDETVGAVVLLLWHLGRMVLEDTAQARECSMEELLARIEAKRRAAPPAGRAGG